MSVDWELLLMEPIGEEAFKAVADKHGLWGTVRLAQLPATFWAEVISECERRIVELLLGKKPLKKADRIFAAKVLTGSFHRKKGKPPLKWNPLEEAAVWLTRRKSQMRQSGRRQGIHEAAIAELMVMRPKLDRQQLENYLRRSRKARTK